MHQTVFGRLVYMVGSNHVAMQYAGVRVAWVKAATFGIAGALAGLGSAVYVGQFGSARADNASEMLLFVVAAVVLGGIDIFGGRGHVIGVLFALLLLGTLKNGMGLANFPGPVQTLIIGALLVASVAIPRFARLRFRLRSADRGSSPGFRPDNARTTAGRCPHPAGSHIGGTISTVCLTRSIRRS